jgi:hypothetical protein
MAKLIDGATSLTKNVTVKVLFVAKSFIPIPKQISCSTNSIGDCSEQEGLNAF